MNPFVKLERLNVIFNARITLNRVKIFQCDKCTCGFLHIENYKLHKLSHVREAVETAKRTNNSNRFIKRYSCPECDAKFVHESTLSAHSVIHDPFPHICECGIGFYEKHVLQHHKKLVHQHNTPNKQVITKKPNHIKNNVTSNEHSESPLIKTRLGTFPKSKAVLVMKTKSTPKPRLKVQGKQTLEITRISSGQFECPVCKKLFAARSNVLTHYRIHTGEKPYSCHLCNKSFTQSPMLKIHLKRHAGIRDIICKYCNKGFFDKGALDLHERIHTGVKPYQCTYCEKAFSDPSSHQRHIRTHTGVKPYCCEVCSMRFSDASGLIAHRRTHNGIKRFTCDICDKKFFTITLLKSHELTVHAQIKRFTCKAVGCPKKFSNKSNMMVHYTIAHTKEKKYECNECGEKYAIKEYLENHISRCHSIRLYCNKCHKRFSCKTYLKQHRAKGCILFQCEKCEKVLFSKRSLLIHLQRHLGIIGEYECDYCGRTFPVKEYLYKHIVYSHLKLLRCGHCKKRFMSKQLHNMHEKNCIPHKYTCDFCHKKCDSKYILKKHLLKEHYSARNGG